MTPKRVARQREVARRDNGAKPGVDTGGRRGRRGALGTVLGLQRIRPVLLVVLVAGCDGSRVVLHESDGGVLSNSPCCVVNGIGGGSPSGAGSSWRCDDGRTYSYSCNADGVCDCRANGRTLPERRCRSANVWSCCGFPPALACQECEISTFSSNGGAPPDNLGWGASWQCKGAQLRYGVGCGAHDRLQCTKDNVHEDKPACRNTACARFTISDAAACCHFPRPRH